MGTLLSHNTPLPPLHFSHPACILLVTSISISPLACTTDPRYLYSPTFFNSYPSIVILSPLSSSPLHLLSMCSVFSLFIFKPLLSSALDCCFIVLNNNQTTI